MTYIQPTRIAIGLFARIRKVPVKKFDYFDRPTDTD